MHPITRKDVSRLVKFTLRNSPTRLLQFMTHPDRDEYHITWVNDKKVWLRKGKTDILVFKKIFIDKEYDFRIKGEVKTIIDAGANIGLSSIFFTTCYPEAKVIAIEPEEANFQLLMKNVASYPKIIPLKGGISNRNGAFTIKNPSADNWNFMLEYNEEGVGRLYTITEVMDMFSMDTLDFLKIDIEGGEVMLFESNFDWLNKVKTLSIELHDFILPASSNNFFKAIARYEPYNFLTNGENHFVSFHQHQSQA